MISSPLYRRLCRCALLMMALCMTVLCLSACIVIHNNFTPAEDDLPSILPNHPVDPKQDVGEPSDLPDDTATEQPTEEEPAEQEPTEQESTESEPTESESDSDTTVWISENGTKYHTSATCSGMKEPTSLPLADARQQGYTACKRCH